MAKLNRLFLLLIVLSTVMITDAFVPVTYSCCKNYIINPGTLLYNFEDINNWTTEGSSNSYIEADTTNFKEGTQGLKLVAKNGNVYVTRDISYNFEKVKNFEFDLYVYNSGTYNHTTIYFTSDKEWSKYFNYTIEYTLDGWNHIILKKSDMYNKGGEDWNNTMIMFRVEVVSIDRKNTAVTVDNFRYDVLGRAKVIFTFDDGTVGDSEIVEPILTANNQRAMSFVITSWLNNTNFMTMKDLKKLQDKGWDISSHTISHPDLTTLDNDNLSLELNNSYDWLVNNGFQKSASFIAYPYGIYDGNVIIKTKQRYILARSTDVGMQPHIMPEYRSNLYKLKVSEARNTTSVQSIKDKINLTIDQGWLTILLFHQIVENNPTEYQYSKADFQQISDYVKSRDSNIDTITLSDYVNIANKYTPIVNKTVRIYYDGNVSLTTNNKYDEYIPNITIRPSSGSIDINMEKSYGTGDQHISFKESASNSSIEVQYSIGDRIPNKNYSINVYWNNGTMIQGLHLMTNDTGYLNYYSTSFDSPRYTEITVLNNGSEKVNKTYEGTDVIYTKSKLSIVTEDKKKESGEKASSSPGILLPIIVLILLTIYLPKKKRKIVTRLYILD